MTEIAARAVVILWTGFAVMPAEIVFDTIVGRREQLVGARNDGAHRTFGEFRWIFASSRVGPQNKKRTDVRDMRGFS